MLGLAEKVGNAEADAAADLGRRPQSEILINARRSPAQGA